MLYCILNPINTPKQMIVPERLRMNFSLFQLLNELRGGRLAHFARALDLYNGDITVFRILW